MNTIQAWNGILGSLILKHPEATSQNDSIFLSDVIFLDDSSH